MFLIRKIFMKNCILSLGSRHTVEPCNLNTQTREKVCVRCVFELYAHSVSVQKIKSLILSWKVVPGGGIEPPTRGFSIQMTKNN
jgi:hypothetical protein